MIEIKNSKGEVLLTVEEFGFHTFEGCHLTDAQLSGLNFQSLQFAGTNFEGANLRGADFRNADMQEADFRNAHLEGANLLGADIRYAHFKGVKFGSNTIMPWGETWKEYCEEVVPALLTSTGKTLKEVLDTGCWERSWPDGPMFTVFGIQDINEGPFLLRPRIKEFYGFFNDGVIPKPKT